MGYRGVPGEIGEPHWFNSSMVDHTMEVNQMKYFRNTTYTVIHGMNDDNVHFLNSAQMEKALVSVGIDFKAFVSNFSISWNHRISFKARCGSGLRKLR